MNEQAPQPVDVITVPKGPQDKVDEIIRPYLAMINSTPDLLSILYDTNMLPEQTVTIPGAIRLAGLCEVWKRMAEAEDRARGHAQSAINNGAELLKLEGQIVMMKSVIVAGDDLYSSMIDQPIKTKYQIESLKTYAKVSNEYRKHQHPDCRRSNENVPHQVPHIVINEEAHGQG